MSEGIFESYDPFAYKVNNVFSLDNGLVKAFQANDQEKIEEIINGGSSLTVDVFITINHHQHACILIVPTGNTWHLSIYNSRVKIHSVNQLIRCVG